MIEYCKKCIYPNTKPNLVFDKKGICNACKNFSKRKKINWKTREKEFLQLIKKQRKYNKSKWDCLIPVSGGKDSFYQIIKCKEMGLKPLCVNATTCDLTNLGKKNLEAMKDLNVDIINVTVSKKVRSKINKFTLETVGDISWPEHVGIYTIPVIMAVKFGINVLIWGENPQNEYGGPGKTSNNKFRDLKWVENYGGMLGLRLSDIMQFLNLDKSDLQWFKYPENDEIKKINLKGLFLGYYFPWNGYDNFKTAKKNGFIENKKRVEGTLFKFENLDNYQTGIHDYFKYLKYGYSRITDHLSLLIRRGKIPRKKASKIAKKFDGKFPSRYLDKSLKEILKNVDLSEKEFNKICDKFTNTAVFKKHKNGTLIKNKNKDLIKIKYAS
jgi:N-acetyl sugar amidotransferase